MMGKSMSGHQSTEGKTDTWFTPPEIIKSLGEFNLDPCTHINRPWDTAKKHLTIEDNSLIHEWHGRVWLNPPYNRYLVSSFMEKMAKHLNGTALLFARTETVHFQRWIFPYAESMLFMDGRITFYDINGKLATIKEGKYKGKTANSGAPSVLISYSEYDSLMIEQSGIKGKHVLINSVPVMIVKNSPSWKNVVSLCLIRLNGEATLKEIYSMAEVIADDKVSKNRHYKEKIRQQLQKHFLRVRTGQYKLIA